MLTVLQEIKQRKFLNNMPNVIVIGAGLAGCEAALRLANFGFNVELYEMKPIKKTPAHKMDSFAELVCSNSLKSNDLLTSGGLLKEELRNLDSLVIKFADKYSVPAGSALAVDREIFSEEITKYIKTCGPSGQLSSFRRTCPPYVHHCS